MYGLNWETYSFVWMRLIPVLGKLRGGGGFVAIVHVMQAYFVSVHTSMKEGISAPLSGRGEGHGGARVIAPVTLKYMLHASQRKKKG